VTLPRRLLVEPACGAALAAVYSGECTQLADVQGPVVVEVCGGAIMDRNTLADYAKQFGLDF
jgi:L-serine/L-threonine ammonia-lyase